VCRGRGDGEGTLKQKAIAGRKVWWGRWVEWTADGTKRRPERILGEIAKFPTKREAREELNRVIRESSGRVTPMPKAPTFKDIWDRYYTLNKSHWGKAHQGAVEPVMRRGILPQIGQRNIAQLTHEPVQAALNHMAEMSLLIGKKNQYTRIGYSESALKTARTYMKAVFEFAIDENVIARNPARKLILPDARKPCERFLSIDEVRRLLAVATGREQVTLRLLLVGGLRPAELFALRTNDIRSGVLRIDEAVKERERQASGRRIGSTKTDESDGIVSLSADLETKLRAWADTRPAGALLFPSERGTTWRIGNYLKRVLKPLAVSVGIEDLTFQCLRRTCATHFGGTVKDAQTQMRHTDPAITLRHYKKTIPESQRAAVEALDAEFQQQPDSPKVPEQIQ
jgi:integrase